MKKPILFIFFSSLIAKCAIASCYCSEPSRPYVPGGYSAERYALESAINEVESYISEVNDYMRCLSDCIDEARSEAESVQDELNNAISSYNMR